MASRRPGDDGPVLHNGALQPPRDSDGWVARKVTTIKTIVRTSRGEVRKKRASGGRR